MAASQRAGADPLEVAVSVTADRRLTILRLSGTLTSAAQLPAVLAGPGRTVVADLANLTACDAGGVNVLAETQHRLHRLGAQLVLINVYEFVRRLLADNGALHLLSQSVP